MGNCRNFWGLRGSLELMGCSVPTVTQQRQHSCAFILWAALLASGQLEPQASGFRSPQDALPVLLPEPPHPSSPLATCSLCSWPPGSPVLLNPQYTLDESLWPTGCSSIHLAGRPGLGARISLKNVFVTLESPLAHPRHLPVRVFTPAMVLFLSTQT